MVSHARNSVCGRYLVKCVVVGAMLAAVLIVAITIGVNDHHREEILLDTSDRRNIKPSFFRVDNNGGGGGGAGGEDDQGQQQDTPPSPPTAPEPQGPAPPVDEWLHKEPSSWDGPKDPKLPCNFRRGRPIYGAALDGPHADDERAFYHCPKSRGGTLTMPDFAAHRSWGRLLQKTARYVFEMFEKFDQNEKSDTTMPFVSVGCVGVDCVYVPDQIREMRQIGIGHYVVIVNVETEDKDNMYWAHFFKELAAVFPGRFSLFHRPDKLSCSATWNLGIRLWSWIRPLSDQIFLPNADWSPKDKVDGLMVEFARWSRTVPNFVVNRFWHFTSFSYTRYGFLTLGYFDEVIFPALAEDVEFHVRANSMGRYTNNPKLVELGLFGRWRESQHKHRASSKDARIQVRHQRVARFDWVQRKWGIRVGSVHDYARALPYRCPFDLYQNPKDRVRSPCLIPHNRSWVVDPVHHKCALTGAGPKMNSPGRRRGMGNWAEKCWYNFDVFKDAGLVPRDYVFPDRLTTKNIMVLDW